MTAQHRTLRPLCAAMALALAAAPAAALDLDYRVEVGLLHDDNINLSESDPVSENVLEPEIGFSLLQEGSTVQARVDGLVEYRHYLDDTYGDELRADLTGIVNWVLMPERLSFTVQDTAGVEPISVLAADTPDNQQQTNVLSLGPTFLFRVGPTFDGQAELRYIDSYAEETDAFNSERVLGSVQLGKQLSATGRISGNVQAQSVDLSEASTGPDYERYDVFARYENSLRDIDYNLDAGYSWLDYKDGAPNRSDPLLRASGTWRATPRSALSLTLARQYSDAATDLLAASTDPVFGVPVDVVTGSTVLNSLTYLERRIEGGYAYDGERVGVAVTPHWRKRDYDDTSDLDQTGRGAAFSLHWNIRPLWQAGLRADYEDLEFEDLGFDVETRRVALWILREWTRHWSTRLEFGRYERESNQPGVENPTSNTILLSVIYQRTAR